MKKNESFVILLENFRFADDMGGRKGVDMNFQGSLELPKMKNVEIYSSYKNLTLSYKFGFLCLYVN